MINSEVARFLKRTPLFAKFTEKELEAVFGTSRVREFAASSTIVREGDVSGVGFYLILDGQVEVRRGQKVLAKLSSGEYFGEASLMLDAPRSADVVALATTRCLMITRWELRAIIGAYPDIALKMMSELAHRLSNTAQALKE